jgi:hypothetical protein
MKEPEDLGRGYMPDLNSFRNVEIVAGNLWKNRME